MLPLKAWSSLSMAFRDRRQMFRTGISLRGRTGQPNFSRRVRVAIRRMKRFSRARFEQKPEDTLALGATAGPFTSNAVGDGIPGPLVADSPNRFDRRRCSCPDTPENLHGSAVLEWQCAAAAWTQNFSAARPSRRLACRQETDECAFLGVGVGGKTTPD